MTKISPYTALCDLFLRKSNVENDSQKPKYTDFQERSVLKINNSCQTQPMRDYSIDKIINGTYKSKETHNINIFHDDNFEILRPDYAAYSGDVNTEPFPERHQRFKFVAEKPHEDVFPRFAKMLNKIKLATKPSSVLKINECTMTDLLQKEIHPVSNKPYIPESYLDGKFSNNESLRINALYKTVSNLKSTIQEKCYNCGSNEKCLCEHCGAIGVINDSLKHPQYSETEPLPLSGKQKKYKKRKEYSKLCIKLKEMEDRINELEGLQGTDNCHKHVKESDSSTQQPKLNFPNYSRSFSPNRFNAKYCPLSFRFSPNKFFRRREKCNDEEDEEDDEEEEEEEEEEYKDKHVSRKKIKEPIITKPKLRSFGYMNRKYEKKSPPKLGIAAYYNKIINNKNSETKVNFEEPTKDTSSDSNNFLSVEEQVDDLLLEFKRKNNRFNEKVVHFTFHENNTKNEKFTKTEDNLLKSILNNTNKEENFQILQVMEPIENEAHCFSACNSSESKQVFRYVNHNYNCRTDDSNSTCFSSSSKKNIDLVIKSNNNIQKNINYIKTTEKKTASKNIKSNQMKKSNSPNIMTNLQYGTVLDSKFKNIEIKNNQNFSSLDSNLVDLTKSDKEHIINKLSKISTSKSINHLEETEYLTIIENYSKQYVTSTGQKNKKVTSQNNINNNKKKNLMFFPDQKKSCTSTILSLNKCKSNENEFVSMKPLMIEKSTELSTENMHRKCSKPKIGLTKKTLMINSIEPVFQNNEENSIKSIIIFNHSPYNSYINDFAVCTNITQETARPQINNPYMKPITVNVCTMNGSNEKLKSCHDSQTSVNEKHSKKASCQKCKLRNNDIIYEEANDYKQLGSDKSKQKKNKTDKKSKEKKKSAEKVKMLTNVQCKKCQNDTSDQIKECGVPHKFIVPPKKSNNSSIASGKESSIAILTSSCTGETPKKKCVYKSQCDKCDKKKINFLKNDTLPTDPKQKGKNKGKSKISSELSVAEKKSTRTVCQKCSKNESLKPILSLTKMNSSKQSSVSSIVSGPPTKTVQINTKQKNGKKLSPKKSSENNSASSLVRSKKSKPIQFKKNCVKCISVSGELVNKGSSELYVSKTSSERSTKASYSSSSVNSASHKKVPVKVKQKEDICPGKCRQCETKTMSNLCNISLNSQNSQNCSCQSLQGSGNSSIQSACSQCNGSKRLFKPFNTLKRIKKSTCSFNCIKNISCKFNCKYLKNLYASSVSRLRRSKGQKTPNYCEVCCDTIEENSPCDTKSSTVNIYFNLQGQNFDDSESSNTDDEMILTANEKRKYLLEKLNLLENYREQIKSTEKCTNGEFE